MRNRHRPGERSGPGGGTCLDYGPNIFVATYNIYVLYFILCTEILRKSSNTKNIEKYSKILKAAKHTSLHALTHARLPTGASISGPFFALGPSILKYMSE